MKINLMIGIVIVLALTACSRGVEGTSSATGDWAQEERAATPAVAVEGVEVSPGGILQAIVASGTVQGRTEASVVSETQGVLTFVSVSLGDYVEAGDALAGVDDSIAASVLEEARAALQSAGLDLDATQRRFTAGSASQSELTRATAATSGARARLQQADKAFQDRTVRAAISGYIADLGAGIGVGNYLQPGTPVARIVDLRSIKMEVGVGERELGYLNVGAPALVSVPVCGDSAIPATVTSIAAGADARTGSFPVVVEWDNVCAEGTIRSGVSASVTIAPSSGENLLVVPGSAVRTVRDSHYVFVNDNGVARRVDVELGERLGNRVYVMNGLSEGDVVITSALSSLTDGAEVTITVVGRSGDVL